MRALMDAWGRTELIPGRGQAAQPGEFQRWGLTKNLVFHTGENVEGGATGHPAAVHDYFAGYIDNLKAHAPWLNVDYVQLSNEPNYIWFSWRYGSQTEAAKAWIGLFNPLDDALRRSHPDTRLLGPCLCSGSMFSWVGWEAWTRQFLQLAKHPLEDWNYHCYNRGAYSHLAWMQMAQAYADSLGRPRPRSIVTEMNYALGRKEPEVARDRFLWWAQQLFLALEHPDKHNFFNYFLLAYKPMDEHNILYQAEDKSWRPNDIYWLYWTLRNLRGRVVYLPPGGDGGVKAFASAPAYDKVTLALFNDSGVRRQVEILPPRGVAKPVSLTRREVFFDAAPVCHHGEKELPSGEIAMLELPPGSVTTLHWQLERPILPSRQLETREYYSHTVGKRFGEDLALNIKVDKLPGQTDFTTLRMGINSDDLLSARGLTVEFNGHPYPVFWNEAPAQIGDANLGDACRGEWWLSIPVENDRVAAENHIVLSKPDTEYRLMFMSLHIEGHESEFSAQMARAKAERRWIQASVAPTGIMTVGDKRPLDVVVRNASDREVSYRIEIALPESLRLVRKPESLDLAVPAGGEKRLEGELEAVALAGESTRIEAEWAVTIHADGLPPRRLAQKTQIYPLTFRIARLADLPQLDRLRGMLTGRKPDVVFEKDGTRCSVWLGWHGAHLAAVVDTVTGNPPKPAGEIGGFWTVDCLELFIDLNNSKLLDYGEGDMQLFLIPAGMEGGAGALAGRVFREQRDEGARATSEKTPEVQVASKATKTGYGMSAIIPLDKVVMEGWKGSPGARIGLNLGLCKPGWSEGILGLPKSHQSPSGWPVIELE